MAMQGLGFDLLSQSAKKDKKTFMDYEPGHVGDDNYLVSRTKAARPKTKPTREQIKNAFAAEKEKQKRNPFGWVTENVWTSRNDKDFMSGWDSVYNNDEPKEDKQSTTEKTKQVRDRTQNTNPAQSLRQNLTASLAPKKENTNSFMFIQPQDEDRSFFEGFYEVDGAITQAEREDRQAQVEAALRDMEKLRENGMLRTAPQNGFNTAEIRRLPGDPNTPATITKLPYKPNGKSEVVQLANYQNAADAKTYDIKMLDGTTKTFTQSELDSIPKDAKEKLTYTYLFGTATSGGGAFNEMLSKPANGNEDASSKNTTSSTAASSKTNSEQSRSSRDQRDASVREQYAARERQIDYSDTEALKRELADIEAAENHDFESKWYKRLERAWDSGDFKTYEKVERQMKTQKDRVKYILENRDRTYEDDFAGQFGANYRAGRISQDEALAWNKYLESPTIENREYAESVSDVLKEFRDRNTETLADDATAPWISQSLAGNIAQLGDQTKAGLSGAAGTGLTAGFMTAATGNPFAAGVSMIEGAKVGYSAGVAAHSFDVMRGSAFKRLIDKGMDTETARAAANDEALISALVEMADTGVDVNTVFDAIVNPKKAGAKGVLQLLGKMGVNIAANVAGEALEEGVQQGVSIANEHRSGSGVLDLLGNTVNTFGGAITNRDPQSREEILAAMREGGKLSLMTAAPAIVMGNAGQVADAMKPPESLSTILDGSDDPIAEMTRRAADIAKTSPIEIPETAAITPKVKKNGYYQMPYVWTAEDGFEYKSRWHTRTPGAPKRQGDTWVVERKIPGVGYGKNRRDPIHEFLVGEKWITKKEWDEACNARGASRRGEGKITIKQRRTLKYGHHKAQK